MTKGVQYGFRTLADVLAAQIGRAFEPPPEVVVMSRATWHAIRAGAIVPSDGGGLALLFGTPLEFDERVPLNEALSGTRDEVYRELGKRQYEGIE